MFTSGSHKAHNELDMDQTDTNEEEELDGSIIFQQRLIIKIISIMKNI
jgi:hypothetical protein